MVLTNQLIYLVSVKTQSDVEDFFQIMCASQKIQNSQIIIYTTLQDFLYQFISEEQSDFEEKTEEDKVKDFLEENDIMTAKDPFSEFLRGQM